MINLIQLDNKTGLRNYNYKYGNEPVWDGTTLKSDPYMGIHIGGGYYVSGEGAYIEYMKDPDGNGYYYLFVSYGFYSPEGGYVMRMFRSENITGPYVDTNGDTPLFDKYVFNYGNNLSRGVPVMQNYKWSWFGDGQTAQGHNSALMDEDGKCYLVYHTKFDNGTIFHNVEVHPMLFNRNGWPLSTPFEHRVGYGQPDEAISREEIVGAYGVIYHGAVKYANLECNEEQTIYLNTDGSISGAYTGSWEYDYSNGRHFLTIKTPTTTFDGCFTYQLMDSISTHTLSFTSLNSEGQNVFWGYKKTFTEKLTTKEYEENEIVVGDTTYSIFWMDVDKFHKDTVVGDFEIEYLFHNKSKGEHNWENWGLGLRIGESQWYLRGDAYSNQILTGSTVGYHSSGTSDYLTVFQDKDVRLNIKRQGASITVFAYADDEYVFSATSYDSPMGGGVVSLCAEAAVVDVKSITKGLLAERETVGITNADGTYTSAFNQEKNSYDALEGDFEVEFDFRNYRHPESKNNWDNFIVRMISDDNTMLIRSDAYAMDVEGSLTYDFDWQWGDFIDIMKGAIVKMNVKRNDDVITYSMTSTTTSHDVFHYNIVQLNAPKTNMRIGFTCEKSMIDILRYEQFFRKQKREEEFETNIDETSIFNPSISVRHGVLYVNAETNCKLSIFDLMGRLVCNVDLMKGENEIRGLDNGVYIVNHQKIVVW